MDFNQNERSRSTKGHVSSNSRLFGPFHESSAKLHTINSSKISKIEDDLFDHFRGFLILGRCLGLIPISGVFKRSYKDLKCSFCSLAGLTSAFCVLLLTLNTGLAIADSISQRKRNASEIADSIRNPIFAFWGLFMYIYFLLRRPLLIKIFKSWAKCNSSLTYTCKDKTLKWTIIFMSVVMLTSTVLENAVLHMEYFVAFDDINGHTIKYGKEPQRNVSILQMYYWRAHFYWSKVVGYNPLFPILAFLNHKLTLYGGNYVDLMMSLFARALYFKFHALCKVAEEILLQPISPLEKLDTYIASENDRQAWNQLAKDHDSLCDVLNDMNAFFSPVVFVSYSINIYFFCMQLLNTLNPEFTAYSIVHSIYSPWSFIHIIARIFLLSLCMARVNEFAHKTREIVMRCPVDLYSGQIAKLDKRVNIGPKLGFSGLGCFTVTKPFMLSILNVVFTIEIVLLQGISMDQSSADAQKGCSATG